MQNHTHAGNNIIDFNKYFNTKYTEEIMRNNTLREFKGYYEYCFINKYEEKYPYFETESIQLEDIFVTLLNARGRLCLVSLLFPKNKFNVDKIKNWLNKYKIDFIKGKTNKLTIKNAESIVSGLLYHDNAIILSVKGSKKLTIDTEKLDEVSDDYKEYEQYVNTAHSKDINFGNSNDNFSIILNGTKMNYIPRIEFNKDRDTIISNGNLIYADYIDMYNGSIGFFNADFPETPVSYIADNDTKITIDIIVRQDETKICIIEYNYIIYTENF